MSAQIISAALLGLGVFGLLVAVLLGPGVAGSYCIYGGIAAIILSAAIFVLYTVANLYREYRAS